MLLIRWPKVSPVHPRLRGELHITAKRLATSTGSSPLARGTLNFKLSLRIKGRFIPACAGNSSRWMRWPAKFPVHPRLRGELATPSTRMLIFPGSSPLARGTLFSIVLMITKRRFIPACAGNSIRRWNCYSRSAVHPRLRGELTVYGLRRIWFYGSSPLARGTPFINL